MTLKLDSADTIAILRLDNGVTNAIGPQMLADMMSALDAIADRYRGLVICGNAKFFSMGFDLPHIYKFDRAEMSEFFREFNRVTLRLFTLPIPTAAAISGHAVAGGMILALTCDYRIADNPKAKLGLNEIKLGVPIPYLTDLMLRHLAGDRLASEINFTGEFISAEEAVKTPLIDQLVTAETAEKAAIEKITRIAKNPAPAFAAMKATRTESVRRQFEADDGSRHEEFLDSWFSNEARKRLDEAAKKF